MYSIRELEVRFAELEPRMERITDVPRARLVRHGWLAVRIWRAYHGLAPLMADTANAPRALERLTALIGLTEKFLKRLGL